MKDYKKDDGSRPTNNEAISLIELCLSLLWKDTTHSFPDLVSDTGLTYESLIGTLLLAKDELYWRNRELDEIYSIHPYKQNGK